MQTREEGHCPEFCFKCFLFFDRLLNFKQLLRFERLKNFKRLLRFNSLISFEKLICYQSKVTLVPIFSLYLVIFIPTLAYGKFVNSALLNADLEAIKSTIFYLESNSGRCTASLISDQGHFLTARHCLQRCLIPNGVFKWAPESTNGTQFYTLDPSKLGHATCDVKLNGKPANVSIEATSLGFILKMDERSFQTLDPELFKTMVQNGFTSEGDFVIFKSELYKDNKKCLNLVNEASVLQKHNVLSYPSKTYRTKGNNSDGESLFFSSGEYYADILANSCLKNVALNSLQVSQLQSRFNFATSFLSSVDAIHGSSGSSVFDDNLNILGILTNVFNFESLSSTESDLPENRYCEGSAKTLKTSTILNILRQQNFDTSILSCGKN